MGPFPEWLKLYCRANDARAVASRQMDPYHEPVGGKIGGLVVGLLTTSILSSLITQRYLAVKEWKRLPWIIWLVFLIYFSSMVYVFGSVIIQYGIEAGSSPGACSSASFLCLGAYLASKTFIYLFLVDRAHIIRGTAKSRLKSKLYLWNCFGMLSIYAVIGTLDFLYRIWRLDGKKCTIGVEKQVLLPLIIFDIVANIYLTVLFLRPLAGTYSVRWHFWRRDEYKGMDGVAALKQSPNTRLRTLAWRTIVGCLATLLISVANVAVLLALDGEVSWLCLMCCTSDILASALIIHWVTSTDQSPLQKTPGPNSTNSRNPDGSFDWLLTPSSTRSWPGQS